jgi:hypothetical protein
MTLERWRTFVGVLLAGTTVLAAVLWWAMVILAAARGRAALTRSRVRRAVDAVTGGRCSQWCSVSPADSGVPR